VGVTERVWAALTSMIKLEDRVARQSDALMAQQTKIENLTERVIRIEAQLELLTGAAMVKKLSRGKGPDLIP
jgi:cell division protein FtsB